MEISKGMYVRTHQGIAKIVEKPNISVVVWNDRKVIYVDENGHPVPTSFNFFVFEDEITVFSFNIIDLIKVGDYVNGHKVINIIEADVCGDEELSSKKIIIEQSSPLAYNRTILSDEAIEDIVTKEQFDACKYVVERNK